MDVVVFAGLPCRRFSIDVTIRCPQAVRYAKARVGAKAASEKESRYNSDVLTLALTPQGRFLVPAQETIQVLARQLNASSGKPASLISKMLAEAVEYALLVGTADTTLRCLASQQNVFKPLVCPAAL